MNELNKVTVDGNIDQSDIKRITVRMPTILHDWIEKRAIGSKNTIIIALLMFGILDIEKEFIKGDLKIDFEKLVKMIH